MSTSQAQTLVLPSLKQQFLQSYDREHETTMRVLRAFPTDQLELKPHPKLRTARELAWLFVIERFFSLTVWNNQLMEMLAKNAPPPPPPDSYEELLATLQKLHNDFATLVQSTPDEDLQRKVTFFTGPKAVGEITRLEFAWFILGDEIHHRGQFSIYLRLADARVPSIYGPTADEPWN
jgi:uncharacterized damage-inducible protein DinB